jgi:hypothetical protein
VDAAEYGDIVDVGPGEYVEQVTLKDGIILWGWGSDVTVIRQPEELPEDAPYALRGAEDAQIRNLKVAAPLADPPHGDPYWYTNGISLGPYSGQLIASCLVSGGFWGGIACHGSTLAGPIIIKDTTVEGCYARPVYLARCTAAFDGCVFGEARYGFHAHGAELSITRSTFLGGGLWASQARVLIQNSWFLGDGIDGNGIDGEFYHVTAYNCLIEGFGAGIHGNSARLEVINCTITGNLTGILCSEVDTFVSNSLIWGNASGGSNFYGGIRNIHAETTVEYCNVQGPFPDDDCSPPLDVWPGYGNIVADPQFRDPQNLDFHLKRTSPCIDACPPDWPQLDPSHPYRTMLWVPFLDMDERPRRLYGGRKPDWSKPQIDMGAYEFWLNRLEPAEGGGMTLTWGSVSDSSYRIYYSDNLVTWHVADREVHSAGDWTTSWTDTEGSGTNIPPSLVRTRFYRVVESP